MGVYKVGKYWHMCYTDKKGNHVRKTTGLERALFSKDQARDLLKERIKKAKKRLHPKMEIDLKFPFEKLAEEFNEEYDGLRDHDLRESSRAGYKTFMKKLVEHFGKIDIGEIQDSDITEYILKRKKDTVRGLGKKKVSMFTVNRELSALRLALNWAVEEKKYLGENPVAKRLTRKKLFKEEPRKVTFSNEEITALLAVAKEPWKSFLLVAINSGMRLEEIQGLRWDEIDIKNRSITLPPERTKNGKGRVVKFGKTLVDFFERLKLNREGRELVFPSPIIPKNGQPKPYSKCFSNTWKRLLKRAGIKKDGHFHDLRRSYITWAMDRGANVKDVQIQVGHEDASTTLKIYAQGTTEGQQRVADLVDFPGPSGELVELPKSQAKA